jgi:hypothetical protein
MDPQHPQLGLHVDFSAEEPLPLSDPAERYQMSHSRRFPVDLFTLLADKDDPALKVQFSFFILGQELT